MKSFSWNSDYETGIDIVDTQHRTLVDISNEYSDFLSSTSVTTSDIEAIIARLLKYTAFHFKEEEALMDAIGLDPRHTQAHKKSHKNVIQDIHLIAKNTSSEKLCVSTDILDLIIHWLAYHILGTDMNMSKQISAIKSGLSASAAFEQNEKEKDKSTEPLVAALNGLFNQISAKNQELRELNANLENEVNLRTKELLISNKELEKLSLTDPLTDMFNRRYAMQQLALLWRESVDNSKPIACLMIDADYFKEINDTYGHDVGDLFLVELGTTLKHAIRTDDIACRLGGDEFSIICPNTDLNGGLVIAEKIFQEVSLLRLKIANKTIKTSLSIGVAVKTDQMDNFESLIKIADQGVYLAKKNGRSCIKTVQKFDV